MSIRKLLLPAFLALIVFGSSASAQKDSLNSLLAGLTQKNIERYIQPLFTTFAEGINSNLYTTAYHKNTWSFGIDFSDQLMFIPSSQRTYSAELPSYFGDPNTVQTVEEYNGQIIRNSTTTEQPTVYGGESHAVFAVMQDTMKTSTSITFPGGNDIAAMPNIPLVQFLFGLPTRTQLRFRLVPLSVGSPTRNILYMNVGIDQQIDTWFSTTRNPKPYAVAIHAAYSVFSVSDLIDSKALAFGIHGSYSPVSSLTLFAGVQYEQMTGTVHYLSKETITTNTEQRVYQTEVAANLSSANNYRVVGGLSYRINFVEVHFHGALATQPVLSAGFSFWIF